MGSGSEPLTSLHCLRAALAWSAMAIPIRVAHGWAIAWLDFYQTPAIVTDGVAGEVKDFFKELGRSKDAYPHNAVNPMTAEIGRLGRPKAYGASDDCNPFGGCS